MAQESDSSLNPGECSDQKSPWMFGVTGTIAIDPVTYMINECKNLSTAMRKASRWSQSSFPAVLGASEIFGEDDPIRNNFNINTGFSSDTGRGVVNNRNPLLSGLIQLRNILCDTSNIQEVDTLTVFQPFLLIIKSSYTSGSITAIALETIEKSFRYGIISMDSKNLQSALIQVVSSLTHCRFEAADQNTDDAVLLKVLRLLEYIIASDFSHILPDESISEVVQTCLSLACNKRRSEVLRRAAEMSMNLIAMRVFCKLKEIEVESTKIDDLQTNFTDTKLPEDVIGGTVSSNDNPTLSLNEGDGYQEMPQAHDSNETDSALKNEKDDTTLKSDIRKEESSGTHEKPYGIVSINEFLGILISMISPSNQYQHMESTRVLALDLIRVAVEVSGTDMPNHPSIMNLVADPISKHTLQIITTSDAPALLHSALETFIAIAITLGPQLKSQLELLFSLLFDTISPNLQKRVSTLNMNDRPTSSRGAESKEMLTEALSLLWIRSPSFFTSLFIEYDCDFDRTDLGYQTLQFLCKLALPQSVVDTTDNVPPICLEGVLSFISSVNERIKLLDDDQDVSILPLHDLLVDKNKKTTFIKCTDLLNNNPKEGIKLLGERGFINNINDEVEVANFFFSKSGRLNKKVLGEFLAKPSNINILKHFISFFDFSTMRVDEALRVLLKSFRLPGESQQIERIVEIFAAQYVSCQNYEAGNNNEEEEPVTPDRDAVFILSYSIIMLNTDLHNPQVKNQMDFESYKRNLRGVYNGGDFPSWYLSKIYHAIRDREIIMPEEHHGTDKWFDDAWNNLISALENDVSALKKYKLSNVEICQFDRYLFEASIDTIIDTLIIVFKEASDDHIITSLMSTIDKCANICIYYGIDSTINKIIDLIADLSTLLETDRDLSAIEDVREEIPLTQIKIPRKEEAITVSKLAVSFGHDFKAQLSTVVLFRLIKKTDYKVMTSWEKVLKIVLALYESCIVNPNFFQEFQRKLGLLKLAKPKPQFVINRSKQLKDSGLLSTFSSFLKGYSDHVHEPADQEIELTLSTIDCVNSLNIPQIFENVSKSSLSNLKAFTEILIKILPENNVNTSLYYESEILFLYENIICFGLLINDPEFLDRLIILIDQTSSQDISDVTAIRLLTYKLLLMRRGNNKHEKTLSDSLKSLASFDKDTLQKHGRQLVKPLLSLADSDSWCCKLLLNSEEYWGILKLFGSFTAFSSEILTFLETVVSSASDINESNFLPALSTLDDISSLGALAAVWEKNNVTTEDRDELDDSNYRSLIETAKESITLTSELGSLYKKKYGTDYQIYPLVQALAHQCFNPCTSVRNHAFNSLHVQLMSIDAQKVSPVELFEQGLFPLLSELSKLEVIQTDSEGFKKSHLESLSLLSKVFLKFSGGLDEKSLFKVWFDILEQFISFYNINHSIYKGEENIIETAGELLKNMILILRSNTSINNNEDFWVNTWKKVDPIYPAMKSEVFSSSLQSQPEEPSKDVSTEAVKPDHEVKSTE